MADIRIQQALQEIQALAAQARGEAKPIAAADGAGFAETLQRALEMVNDVQQIATRKSDAFLRGEDVALTDVVIATQKAQVAFTAVTEVRNHLLEAYRTISRMQV